ncbi:MAG TPA: hypothetical protein VFQ53_30490 [Kofleriaceae bacterium]|nr:hypothetical protein [Kofleriaceae bacterium]
MHRAWVAGIALAVCACGSKPKPAAPVAPDDIDEPAARGGPEIRLVPSVAAQVWYRSPTSCGQGPYELELPLDDARWQQELELQLATPRRIALHAVLIVDGIEGQRTAGVFGPQGSTSGAADNARCVADTKERLAALRGGGGGSGGATTPGVPTGGTRVEERGHVDARLVIEHHVPTATISVLHVGWPDRAHRPRSVRVRLWSIEPNDLDGVRFGIARIAWRPNVPEAEYDAYLARRAEEERRLEQQRREREEQRRRELEAEWQRRQAELAKQHVTVKVRVKTQAELDAERERARRAELERLRAEEAARLAELERQREAEEERLHREREAALERDRVRRRRAYCDAHHDDRDCWGAGGYARHAEFEQRLAERTRYCATNPEDARCWTDDERARRDDRWRERVRVALEPPKQPEGPPPAPLDETMPPKLSEHAEWRPGYWQWTGTTWAWLGGMWRVPDSDIVADATTHAPVAPPPEKLETIPPPPMPTTVWVAGFWQWNGTSWVWIAGSYQARPAGMVWRRATWQPRGSIHVLVPGGWVRGGR